jgi:cell division protein ZapE
VRHWKSFDQRKVREIASQVKSIIFSTSISFSYLSGPFIWGRMAEMMQDRYGAAVAAGTLMADPAQQAVLPALECLRDHLDARPARNGLRGLFGKASEAPRGLYLWGGVGTGKSMLMDLFVDAVKAPARRVHFHAFMQEIHAGMFAARKRGVDDPLKPVAEAIAAEVRLLAFDEMQITDITDAMIVGRLFEALFAAGVVVVTTSNRAPDTLYQDGLNRALFLPFIELLKQRMDVHQLESGHDYRQDKLAGSPVYFTPADGKAVLAIDAIWQRLAGSGDEPLTLRVNGRDVVLPAYNSGVARVGFWDLCGKALGPADYLAVAAAVRVLILENVPSLSRSNYNEAKRFVTLIDALYEARVKLVISAADIPDRLYLEGEGTFEFARTASRLVEMQSDGWGLPAPT